MRTQSKNGYDFNEMGTDYETILILRDPTSRILEIDHKEKTAKIKYKLFGKVITETRKVNFV